MRAPREGRFAFRTELYWSDKLSLVAAPVTIVAAGAFLTLLVKGATSGANSIDSGARGVDSPAYISSLAPDKRVEHDFANTLPESGLSCLESTDYNPASRPDDGDAQKSHAVGIVSLNGGVVKIVPGDPNQREQPLELLLNDGTAPLQPANQASAEILASFGCKLGY